MKKTFILAITVALALFGGNSYSQSWVTTGNAGSTPSKLGTTDAKSLKIITGNKVRIFIDSVNGNVGIGNQAPGAKLHVTGGVNVDGNIIMSNSTKTLQFADPIAGNVPMMTMFKTGSTNLPRMVIAHSPAYPSWGLQYDDGTDKFDFLSGGTSVQTIDLNSQNVGVGTASPTSRLHVTGLSSTTSPVVTVAGAYVGNSDVRGISVNSKPADGYGYGVEATGGYYGGAFYGSGGTYTGGAWGVYGNASGSAGTRYGVYGTASGGTENWGGYFPTKTYTNELRVGGTAGATGYVAAINGKLIATEVRVEPQGTWPDYVFGDSYNLLPLDELERKLNADKHLPGVPSACEVQENGIMLGEMQTKTMEKLEENTLYIIQLNKKTKEIDQLNERVKELEKKIDQLTKLIK